jgi:K+ transporter
MTAAYGFSITIAMLSTTILMYYFMRYVKALARMVGYHYPLRVLDG